jgi:phage terminase large subunit-like protein
MSDLSEESADSPPVITKPVSKSAKRSKSKRGALVGSATPRVHSVLQKGNKDRAVAAIAFAEEIGLDLMPWQKNAIGEMLKTKNDRYIWRLTSLVCSRQQGKTFLAALRILAGVYLFGEKDILMMSVNRRLSLITFRQINTLIKKNPKLAELHDRTYVRAGEERIIFKNGAQISVVAATPNGARGMSADFLFIDELRAIDQETWDAAVYTTNARPAQILTVSNAGDKHSKVLNDLRERALSNSSPTLGWLEWSAHPSRAIMDKKGWVESCPALGHYLELETIEHLARTNDPMAFRTEILCQWVDNTASPFEPGSFEACATSGLIMTEGGELFFAFDKSHTQRYAVLVAGQKVGEIVNLFVIKEWESQHPIDEVTLASDINALIKQWRPRITLYDRYMTQNTATYLSASGAMLADCSGRSQVEASHRFAQMMSSRKLAHNNDPRLTSAVANCSSKITEHGWRLVRRRSSGEICAAIAAAMVSWQASQPQSVAVMVVN